MAKRPKPKRKPLKRGPKEERLVIPDPQAALDKLLKKPLKKSLPPRCGRCGGDGVELTDLPGVRQWFRCVLCGHLWSRPKPKPAK